MAQFFHIFSLEKNMLPILVFSYLGCGFIFTALYRRFGDGFGDGFELIACFLLWPLALVFMCLFWLWRRLAGVR